MLRGHIAATSLKMLLKNLYSVKWYDKLNMNVLTLSLWENFWWGLIYFDQFIMIKVQYKDKNKTCQGHFITLRYSKL